MREKIQNFIHNIWKVEKDGSLSLRNRFGHSGRYNYEHLEIISLLEFQFVDLGNIGLDPVSIMIHHCDSFVSYEKCSEAENPK